MPAIQVAPGGLPPSRRVESVMCARIRAQDFLAKRLQRADPDELYQLSLEVEPREAPSAST